MMICLGLLACLLAFPGLLPAQGYEGYYRFPTLHDDTIVFTSEGDLWRVSAAGGLARRLTTDHGMETDAAISPDGKWLAFSAEYEGPTEVYTMPLAGGLPVRRTYEGESARVVGWTPDGKILYATRHYATLPNTQLATVALSGNRVEVLPLSQAADGRFEPEGKTLFFTRLPFHGAKHLEIHVPGARGGALDHRLPRHQQGTPVVEQPHLFHQRPRRNHERLVHG